MYWFLLIFRPVFKTDKSPFNDMIQASVTWMAKSGICETFRGWSILFSCQHSLLSYAWLFIEGFDRCVDTQLTSVLAYAKPAPLCLLPPIAFWGFCHCVIGCIFWLYGSGSTLVAEPCGVSPGCSWLVGDLCESAVFDWFRLLAPGL